LAGRKEKAKPSLKEHGETCLYQGTLTIPRNPRRATNASMKLAIGFVLAPFNVNTLTSDRSLFGANSAMAARLRSGRW
jgi:hypothetical protein